MCIVDLLNIPVSISRAGQHWNRPIWAATGQNQPEVIRSPAHRIHCRRSQCVSVHSGRDFCHSVWYENQKAWSYRTSRGPCTRTSYPRSRSPPSRWSPSCRRSRTPGCCRTWGEPRPPATRDPRGCQNRIRIRIRVQIDSTETLVLVARFSYPLRSATRICPPFLTSKILTERSEEQVASLVP